MYEMKNAQGVINRISDTAEENSELEDMEVWGDYLKK